MSKEFGSLRMGKVLVATKKHTRVQVLSSYSEGIYPYPSESFTNRVKRESYALGAPVDDLGQLCEWIVYAPPLDDDEEHWMNMRPY